MLTSGSITQLYSTGLQDGYLTLRPQMCLFKGSWKQYGNFSMTLQEQTNNGTVNFGQKIQCQLQRMGDMIGKVYVHVTLDELKYKGDMKQYQLQRSQNSIAPIKAGWTRGVGLALIDNVNITIGNQVIDQYNSEWAFVWYELTHKKDFKEGYKKMVGYTDEFNELEEPNQYGVIKPQLSMYIPINFWFTRSYKMALPLISLSFHQCVLQFSIANRERLINWTGTEAIDDFQMGIRDFIVKAEYIYLEEQERERIESMAHDYLIEIVQYSNPEQLNSQQNQVQHKYNIKMGHPCKELVFYTKTGAFSNDNCNSHSNNRNRFLCYTSDDNKWSQALDQGANNISNSMIKTLLAKDLQQSNQNNQIPQVNQFSQYLPNVNMGTNGQSLNVNVNMGLHESVNLNSSSNMISDYNGELQPIPDKQFRRLNHDGKEYVSFNYSDQVPNCLSTKPLNGHMIRFDINFYDQYGYKFKNDDVLEYAKDQVLILINEIPIKKDNFNYGTLINHVQVDIQLIVNTHQLASPQEKLKQIVKVHKQRVQTKDHTLDIDIASIPTNQCEDNRTQIDKNQDIFLTLHDNYGLRIDSTGNPLQNVRLYFNQTERLGDSHTNQYYNFVQAYQHHDTIPKDGINMYSFALDPNSQQPSGSANFSRIDNISLLLTYQDKIRQHKQRGPKLDFIRDTKIHCFTRSLNVFKVGRGLGGLYFV